jgi:hypothetical protein
MGDVTVIGELSLTLSSLNCSFVTELVTGSV